MEGEKRVWGGKQREKWSACKKKFAEQIKAMDDRTSVLSSTSDGM